MKKTLVFLVLLLMGISCEKVDSEDSSTISETLKNAPVAVDLMDKKSFDIPLGLILNCQKGRCDDLQTWVNNMTNLLENICEITTECEDKSLLFSRLIYIKAQLQGYGFDNIVTIDKLCGGFFNPENAKVKVTPDYVELEVGDEIKLNAEIVYGDETCTGKLKWEALPEGIVTVDEWGNVKAISNGTAAVHAMVENVQEILGTCSVKVGDDDPVYDIVFLLESNYQVTEMLGFYPEEWDGFRSLSSQIYNKFLMNFGTNSRFGLVEFAHYYSSPWCESESYCLDGYYRYEDGPFILSSPFYPHLQLTNDPSRIMEGFESLPLMTFCVSDPNCQFSAAHVSAIIKTIENYSWSENASKNIVVFGKWVACYNPNTESIRPEGVSGYTLDNAIIKAYDNDVRVYMMNYWSGSSNPSNVALASYREYNTIANGTGGKSFTNQPWYQVMDLVNFAFDNIAEH